MQTANSFICIFSDAFSATENWNKSRNHEKVDRKNRLFNKGHHILFHWSYVVAPEHLCRLLTDKNIWVSPADKWLILLLWSDHTALHQILIILHLLLIEEMTQRLLVLWSHANVSLYLSCIILVCVGCVWLRTGRGLTWHWHRAGRGREQSAGWPAAG